MSLDFDLFVLENFGSGYEYIGGGSSSIVYSNFKEVLKIFIENEKYEYELQIFKLLESHHHILNFPRYYSSLEFSELKIYVICMEYTGKTVSDYYGIDCDDKNFYSFEILSENFKLQLIKIKKVLSNLNLYYGDFHADNFTIKNEILYLIDLESLD